MISVPSFLKALLGRRPDALQVAAICLRGQGDQTEVLLVTSLETGRWIVPKGWPMRGRTLAEAALREAWEEAGVKGTVDAESLGDYHYSKKLKNGLLKGCKVLCYRVRVDALADTYPEAGRRRRQWMSVREAANKVSEKDLKRLLRQLA